MLGQPGRGAHPIVTHDQPEVTWVTRCGALVLVGAVAAVGMAVTHVVVADALNMVPALLSSMRTLHWL